LGSYTYGDSAHLHAATAIGPSGGTATWTASYDAAGNMLCRAPTSAKTCAGTTPTGPLLTYDSEGRLTAWQNTAYFSGVHTGMEEALYDGAGQRVQQLDASSATNTTTQHTYVGGTEDVASQWATTGGTVTTTTTAYYGVGLAESVNGALRYTLSDGLGSVNESVSAANGTVSATQLYGPYGAVRYQSGTLPTDYAFTHQRADATSGLDYYNARSYDPVAGQFTSADTTLAGGLNRYAYVGGNPETNTDPSGHILRAPRDFNPSYDLSQPQPAQVYVNQWAAPGSVGGFAQFVGQTVLGTDTLNQSYHTIIDPHASLGDKAKAFGVGAFVVVGDVVTVGSLFIGQPEVGAEVRTADEALLAAETTTEVTTKAATEVTTEASPSLLRTGGAGAKLPMSMDTVNSVAQKYGIVISDNDITINKAIDGVRGATAPDQSITLFRGAFRSEEELAKTLVHEQYHVAQLQAGMPYPPSFAADSPAEIEAEAFAQAWWESLMR